MQVARILGNREKLLAVLERADGTKNDIRFHVVRRRIPDGTRSDDGRDCSNACLTAKKTGERHDISF